MTDTYVENFLIKTFEDGAVDMLTPEEEGTTVKYTNVNYENQAFERPEDGYWFELHFQPATPYQCELGQYGMNRWKSFMQINVCVPLDSGMSALKDRCDAVYSIFKRGYITHGIRILSVARSSARTFDDYCSQTVSVYWEADLKNSED